MFHGNSLTRKLPVIIPIIFVLSFLVYVFPPFGSTGLQAENDKIHTELIGIASRLNSEWQPIVNIRTTQNPLWILLEKVTPNTDPDRTVFHGLLLIPITVSSPGQGTASITGDFSLNYLLEHMVEIIYPDDAQHTEIQERSK